MEGVIPRDFQIISSTNTIDVSFHILASSCRLLDRKTWPVKRYETYVRASPDVLKVFVDCVYKLVNSPESVKSLITPDNIHSLALLAQEFDCVPLLGIITELLNKKAHKNKQEEQVRQNIDLLARAIEAQNADVCAHIECLLAKDIDESLKQLKEIPISRIPLPILYRLIEKSIEDNAGKHIDRLLCDFILAKLDSEEDPNLCSLVNFLHVDRLSWEQVERLFSNKKLEGWLCHDFPVQFLQDMLAINRRLNDDMSRLQARQEEFEAETMQKMRDLQAENGEYKRRLGEAVEGNRKEFESRFGDIERQVKCFENSFKEHSSRMEEAISELKTEIAISQAEIPSLRHDFASIDSEISTMKRDIDRTQSRIHDITQAIHDAQGDIVRVRTMVDDAQFRIKSLDASIGVVIAVQRDMRVPKQ